MQISCNIVVPLPHQFAYTTFTNRQFAAVSYPTYPIIAHILILFVLKNVGKNIVIDNGDVCGCSVYIHFHCMSII